MKENKIKIILCSILAVISIFALTMLNFRSSSLTEDVINKLNDSINSLDKYANKFTIPLKGKVAMKANYKGAHGESFPREFNFNYVLEGNILYFSNDEGYNKLELNKELVDFFNTFYTKGVHDDIYYVVFEAKEEKDDGTSINASLDISRINEYFDSNFKKAELTINKKNIISNEVKDVTLSIDDYIITIDNNKYKIMYNDQIIDTNIVNNGYSLSVNNNVNMNVTYEKNVDNYNIVVDNFVYSLDISNNNVKFMANTRASVYNSIEVDFMGDEDVTVEKRNESSIINNPLTRYFAEKE